MSRIRYSYSAGCMLLTTGLLNLRPASWLAFFSLFRHLASGPLAGGAEQRAGPGP